MKRLIISLSCIIGGLTLGFAQQDVKFQTACHPQDVKHYDTQTL